MARVTPDNSVAFPDLFFPRPWLCRTFPGLYLDTPLWIPCQIELEVVAACFPADSPIWVSFSDVELDVRIDDEGEMYAGFIIKTVRTDDWLLCKCHCRITFYHPSRTFLVQPGRVPYVQSQLPALRARITAMVDRTPGVYTITVQRNPKFDRDSKRERTVVWEIGMLSGGLAPLLWKFKAMVEAVAQQGRTPSWTWHMRAWGCQAIGRAPSDVIAMGFWANKCRWPLREERNPWPASGQEVAEWVNGGLPHVVEWVGSNRGRTCVCM